MKRTWVVTFELKNGSSVTFTEYGDIDDIVTSTKMIFPDYRAYSYHVK